MGDALMRAMPVVVMIPALSVATRPAERDRNYLGSLAHADWMKRSAFSFVCGRKGE
jgi:hypothetical protein